MSIIIPTYNSQNTIKKCIKSVLKIHKIPYEIILIDDGSTDKTFSINTKFAKYNNHIKSFYQHNQGVSVARNKGIRESSGDWICFIDSDDTINSTKLENIYKLYTNPKNDLIVSNILFNGKILGIHHSKHKIYNINSFLKQNYPLYGNELIHVVWNKIYKSNIIKRYNIKFPLNITIGEDLIFNIKYLLKTKKHIVQTASIYYNYKINKNSVTNNFDNNAFHNRISIINNLNKLYKSFNLPNDANNYILIKSIYSILLNTLNNKSHNLIKLKLNKLEIENNDILMNFNKNNNYKYLEFKILFFIFKQPSILLLYISLNIINTIRSF